MPTDIQRGCIIMYNIGPNIDDGLNFVTCEQSLESTFRKKVWNCFERNTNIASRWLHRESNLMFTLSSDKYQRKQFAFAFAECKQTFANREPYDAVQ